MIMLSFIILNRHFRTHTMKHDRDDWTSKHITQNILAIILLILLKVQLRT